LRKKWVISCSSAYFFNVQYAHTGLVLLIFSLNQFFLLPKILLFKKTLLLICFEKTFLLYFLFVFFEIKWDFKRVKWPTVYLGLKPVLNLLDLTKYWQSKISSFQDMFFFDFISKLGNWLKYFCVPKFYRVFWVSMSNLTCTEKKSKGGKHSTNLLNKKN